MIPVLLQHFQELQKGLENSSVAPPFEFNIYVSTTGVLVQTVADLHQVDQRLGGYENKEDVRMCMPKERHFRVSRLQTTYAQLPRVCCNRTGCIAP
jgi:hypothetical protein